MTPMVGANGKSLAFDVVSIREDKAFPSPQNPPQFGVTTDGYRLRDLPINFAIMAAFAPVQGANSGSGYFNFNQIAGVPEWASSTRYDVDARVSGDDLSSWKDPVLQPAMLRAMLQAMLAERFKLAVHRELKEQPIFELTLSKGGPKFRPAEKNTFATIQRQHPNAIATFGGAIVANGAAPGQSMLFGVTMPTLCTMLSNMAGRPIQDETGLKGAYDVTYQLELPPLPPPGDGLPPMPNFSSQIPAIVRDQLGLKLTPARGTVEMLVIDRLEKPSEN
ncbi:MAG TPA: TIGR03435 family protein [Acidobacteriaceae bacterium]|nr:TIGR03435 family protein [Acidobacteriaceae bacterium]